MPSLAQAFQLKFSLLIKAILLILVVNAFWTRDQIFTLIVTVAFGFSLIPKLLERHIWLPSGFDFCLSTILLAHVFLGMTLELYESSAFYDKISHFSGTAIFSWLALKGLDRHCLRRGILLPSSIRVGFILMFSLALGAIWEIFEFLIDQTELVMAQRGLADTMYDLITDLFSGMTISFLAISLPGGFVLRENKEEGPSGRLSLEERRSEQ